MGSVKLETRNEGRGLREWDYVPLSEPRIVSQLIKNRWRVDEAFYPKLEGNASSLSCNGVFPFSEPVLVTYIDLDNLIAETPLTKSERKIVHWLMEGYEMPDIADHYGITVSHVGVLFFRAVKKIVDTCNENYKSWGNYIYGGVFPNESL